MFTNAEREEGLKALVEWVEKGVKPDDEDILVDDLRTLGRKFAQLPRPGSPEAETVPGARDRAVVRGDLTVDGAPFDAKYLGAIVRRNGLITPRQYTLSSVGRGSYEITVRAETEASGCGMTGTEILLWTFAQNQILHSRESVPWPGGGGTVTFNGSFTSAPDGGAPTRSAFNGEVYGSDGERLPPGTRVEAYVGDVRCGVGSTSRTGNYSGYILDVVGPNAVAGCNRGAALSFRIDGQLAAETAINDLGGDHGGHSLDLTLPARS